MLSTWAAKQRDRMGQKKNWNVREQLQPEHSQCLSLSLYLLMSVLMKKKKQETRYFRRGLWIYIQLLDQSPISHQTKLTCIFPHVLDHCHRAHSKSLILSAVSFLPYLFFFSFITFTSFMGLFFFRLFDMLLHQWNSNEKRK